MLISFKDLRLPNTRASLQFQESKHLNAAGARLILPTQLCPMRKKFEGHTQIISPLSVGALHRLAGNLSVQEVAAEHTATLTSTGVVAGTGTSVGATGRFVAIAGWTQQEIEIRKRKRKFMF